MYRKGVRVNYKNVSYVIMVQDHSHKEFSVNRVTLGIEPWFFLPN